MGLPSETRTSRERLNRSQWNTLATICLVLLIEISVAVQLLLQQLTGERWHGTSLALAFVAVFLMHQPLEQWIWGDPSKNDNAVGLANRE